MGTVPALPARENVTLTCCSTLPAHAEEDPLDTLVKRFCQIDESPLRTPPTQSPAEIECEHFFRETTERDKETGRYIVSLPFRDDIFSLGDTYETARKRFLMLERKFEAAPEFKAAYDSVIHEYLEKGYLSPAPLVDSDNCYPVYVIPHHGVLRTDKTTTKLRMVLDASHKSSSGRSLNDILHSGPNLQGDLFAIILNFRLFATALSADCKQMFLQIIMNKRDRRFQRMLYRFHPQEELTEYEFNRVCFGLRSSPYHALRVIQQLIADDGDSFRLAKIIASRYIYMDDIVFSVMSEEEAASAANELIELFKRAQFDLVKWTCNSDSVLSALPSSYKMSEPLEFDKTAQFKILGLSWDKSCDCFEFKVTKLDERCSKRIILATVARIWDIMGFVAPVVLFAKLLIKDLWLLKLDWDDCPPQQIVETWKRFCIELPLLNDVKIPRHLGVFEHCVVRLVGFSDASERAYGAVVYAHITQASQVTTRLVCAKSKVSPMKPLSIARLELCAAELLARLIKRVHDTYDSRYHISDMYAFTDSMVTLCWINSSPHRWQTFVANRVVKIIDNLPAANFHHVAGIDNPADCLSRGLTPERLISHPLWSQGPSWLAQDLSLWPITNTDHNTIALDNVPKEKITAHPITTSEPETSLVQDLNKRISSWSRLTRILVYVCRFINKLPRSGSIAVTAFDISAAEHMIIGDIQKRHFAFDIRQLGAGSNCSPALMKLKPFLCDGLIHVGGRLTNSAESSEYKFPIILPRHDALVESLIDYYHKKYLHAGPELLMSLLRQRFWILSARRIIRSRINKCNTCFKLKPRPRFPLMSALPGHRVTQAEKAFAHTGCDYCGPILYTPIRDRVKTARGTLVRPVVRLCPLPTQ
ncbi:unnamed protein product [Parnassius mnemosyne]|uniref:Integrase zinc-binding domain-containing protein n=1 Tax=Parnassius mnemosyne TaxID=213953 RepID=A0AAV1LUT1_9NEOP